MLDEQLEAWPHDSRDRPRPIIGKRVPPDMMSASEGGRGSWKSGCSKGGGMNLVV